MQPSSGYPSGGSRASETLAQCSIAVGRAASEAAGPTRNHIRFRISSAKEYLVLKQKAAKAQSDSARPTIGKRYAAVSDLRSWLRPSLPLLRVLCVHLFRTVGRSGRVRFVVGGGPMITGWSAAARTKVPKTPSDSACPAIGKRCGAISDLQRTAGHGWH